MNAPEKPNEQGRPHPDLETIEEWKHIITMQIHFSDMLIRTRSIALSAVLAAYGATAVVSENYPNLYVKFGALSIPVSTVIAGFAILLLLSIFVIDYFYYYKLLLHTVFKCVEFEREHGIRSQLVSHLTASLPVRTANLVILVYYGIPMAVGLALIWYTITSAGGGPPVPTGQQ